MLSHNTAATCGDKQASIQLTAYYIYTLHENTSGAG